MKQKPNDREQVDKTGAGLDFHPAESERAQMFILLPAFHRKSWTF